MVQLAQHAVGHGDVIVLVELRHGICDRHQESCAASTLRDGKNVLLLAHRMKVLVHRLRLRQRAAQQSVTFPRADTPFAHSKTPADKLSTEALTWLLFRLITWQLW